jgi:DNA-directed RNA polymerase subunit E'/Rpb7
MSTATKSTIQKNTKTASGAEVVKTRQQTKYEFAPIYHTRILSENIQLMPKALNTYDLDKVIIDILKKKVEGKCISDGFIKQDSVEIVSRSLGCMENHVFNGSVNYFIKYKADVCSPVMDQIIECYVETNDETNSVCYVGDEVTSPVEIYLFRENYVGNAEYASLRQGDRVAVRVLKTQVEFGNDKILVGAEFLGKI